MRASPIRVITTGLGDDDHGGEHPDAGQPGQHPNPRTGPGVRAQYPVRLIDQRAEGVDRGQEAADDLARYRRQVQRFQPRPPRI